MKTLDVAADLLREALSRKWFLALGAAITVLLAVIGFSLKIEVVDGVLSAARLFGKPMHADIRAADLAMRPVFQGAAYVIFYGGILFFVLACADFGPSLLAPGRIEHLLALPVRRWELLAGTFLGVLLLAAAFSVYGAGGFTLILAVKTGVWTPRLLVASLLGAVTFASLYGAMLATAVLARSAALSAAMGALLFAAGVVAGYREAIAEAFEPGAGRSIFEAVTLMLPRVSALAKISAQIAGSEPVDSVALLRLVLGVAIFGAAALALGIHRFEQKDF